MKKLLRTAVLWTLVFALAGCSGEIFATEPSRTAATEPPETVTAATEPTAAPTQEATEVTEPPTTAPALTPEEEVLAGMTLREKAAQLLLVSCHDPANASLAAQFGAGGLCLYANAFEGKDKTAVQEMTASLQADAKLPLLISVDEEGGTVCRVSLNPALRSSRFRSPRELYEAGGWELVDSDTLEKAQLLLELGINVNLAPVCDVPQSSGDYIYPRCFSMDPEMTAQYIARVVGIMEQQGLGSTLKHFPGYGGSGDTHMGMAYDSRDYSAFTGGDFLPFSAGIASGAGAVMVSHNIVGCMDPDYPASLSPEVHRILREELGFSGVIITDDLVMGAISQFTGGQNAAVQAILAGNDLLCCEDFEGSAAAIVAAVEDGTIPEARIDASVLRILRWKTHLGLNL